MSRRLVSHLPGNISVVSYEGDGSPDSNVLSDLS